MSQSDFVTRGQGLVAAGQYQEAVKVCRLGLLGRPTAVDGRLVLAQALLALRRFDEVLAEVRVALDLEPDSRAANVLKAEALIKKGDFLAALAIITPLVKAHPGDRRIGELHLEATRGSISGAAGPRSPRVKSSVEFVSKTSGGGGNARDDDDSDLAGHLTQPTSLSPAVAAVARKLPRPQPVADPSGTADLDLDEDGVEVDDADVGPLASPPAAADHVEPRGSIKRRTASPARAAGTPKKEQTSVELDDDELIEVTSDTAASYASELYAGAKPAAAAKVASPSAARGAAMSPAAVGAARVGLAGVSRVREAVALPSGLVSELPLPAPPGSVAAPSPFANVKTVVPTKAGSAIAAALPTAAAMPLPPASPAAAHPTMAIHTGSGAGELFNNGASPGPPPNAQAPAWAKATVAAQPMVDPAQAAATAAALPGVLDSLGAEAAPVEGSQSVSRPHKLGAVKKRSKAAIAGWIVVGAVVIGGGVFAGFQIRAVRLANQIDAARTRATDTARADTWRGWLTARDALAGIAQASPTLENRAALARARAEIAYEFGDGAPEAKIAADNLGDKGGFDGAIAAAFVALAGNDEKQAKAAVARAGKLAETPVDEAAAHYAGGRLALLTGDTKVAQAELAEAVKLDDRAGAHLALARVAMSQDDWDAATAEIAKATALSKDDPAAILASAEVAAASSKRTPDALAGAKTALAALIAEGGKPIADQVRGVSPLQVALARVDTARVEVAQGDPDAALKDTVAAVSVGVDDVRLAESVCEALLGVGPPAVTEATKQAAARYPTSRRVALVIAEDLLARGRGGEAIDALHTPAGEAATALVRGLAVRGQARLATGDLEGARGDFDLALKQAPLLEIAVIGRAMVDLAKGEIDAARIALEPKLRTSPSAAMLVANARVARARGDAEALASARVLLDKAIAAGGPDVPDAQIELARLLVDTGDARTARTLLEPLAKAGNGAARTAQALAMIEDGDPQGGRKQLDELVATEGGGKPPMLLALDTARARTLTGDHAGAEKLLDAVEKSPGVVGWMLDRERARLAIARGDWAKAGEAIGRALDTSNRDAETLLLAADVAYADLQTDNAQGPLVDKVRGLAQLRLGPASPEAAVIAGKLALAAGIVDEADTQYRLAKAAYDKQKGTRRRMAQVDFGLAIVALDRGDAAGAKQLLDGVIVADPTSYDALLFDAQLVLDGPAIAHAGGLPPAKDARHAFELAQRAVMVNPDSIAGWHLYGLAAIGAIGHGKAVGEAIAKLTELAPASDELRDLQKQQKH